MVVLKAKVLFKEPKVTYCELTELTTIAPNIIVMDLSNFGIINRGTLRSQYDFKPVDERDHMVNDYCDISGHDFLLLVGETIKKAEHKLAEKKGFNSTITAHNVNSFYNELNKNTIDKVTLSIVELW